MYVWVMYVWVMYLWVMYVWVMYVWVMYLWVMYVYGLCIYGLCMVMGYVCMDHYLTMSISFFYLLGVSFVYGTYHKFYF